MVTVRLAAGFFLLCLSSLLPDVAGATNSRNEHTVYFPNTPYELNTYKIHGHQPGPTLMLIGGIQGNEPGGFLSADLYADVALERGNLIVVPRANFNSILQFKRGVNGDMNRRFASKRKGDTEDEIVGVLKSLLAQSDCLLNLHDGSGFILQTGNSVGSDPSHLFFGAAGASGRRANLPRNARNTFFSV